MWCVKKVTTIVAIWLLSAFSCFAQNVQLKSVRYEDKSQKSKIVFEVSEPAKYSYFVVDKPARIVIDIKGGQAKNSLQQPATTNLLYSNLRTSVKNESDLRITIGLKEPLTSKNHKLIIQNLDNNHFAINVSTKNTALAVSKNKDDHVKTSESQSVKQTNISSSVLSNTTKASYSKPKSTTNKSRRFIVAIDAGHGGDDPGAKGQNGTLEKQVTLAIATKLQGLINGQPGMKAKLVRKGDYYVGLRERMKIARQANADFFVSIHADACQNPEVKGASVYTLSRTGASNEAARWLANNENAKEKVGGVNLDDKDEMLASVLLDLSQTATQQASMSLAQKVLNNFQSIGSLHYDTVQQAGFAVLKSPDIPSILVETAYISNTSDELNLLSSRYQTKMANAIFKGILKYVEQMKPEEINRMAKL